MPRRNRNAHSLRIDTDELAAQAGQLTAELGTINGRPVYLADEIQLYYRLGGISGGGKSSALNLILAHFTSKYPRCQISLTDAKAVTSHGHN